MTMSPDVKDGRVVAYVRVSTNEQAVSGLGVQAQRDQILAECDRRGWHIVEWCEDLGVSGEKKRLDQRPGGQRAIALLEQKRAYGLIAARLNRLSRSRRNMWAVADMFQDRKWALTLLDVGLDSSTAMGAFLLGQAIGMAQYESDVNGERTRAAMAILKAQGVTLGRPVEVDPEVEARVVALRRSGAPLRAIVARLTTEGVPCARGGTWHMSTVRRILDRHAGELPTFGHGHRQAAV